MTPLIRACKKCGKITALYEGIYCSDACLVESILDQKNAHSLIRDYVEKISRLSGWEHALATIEGWYPDAAQIIKHNGSSDSGMA